MNSSLNKITLPFYAVILSLLIIGGCDSLTKTTTRIPSQAVKVNSNNIATPIQRKEVPTFDERMANLGNEISGFGGLFINKSGQLSIYLTNPAKQKAKAKTVLSSFKPLTKTLANIRAEGKKYQSASVSNLNIKKGRYTFVKLYSWKNKVTYNMLNMAGIYTTGIDESQNQLDIGVKSKAIKDKAIKKLAQLHIPREAVTISKISKPVLYSKTLRSKFSDSNGAQIGAGVEIAYSIYGCSMGAIVSWDNQEGNAKGGFITASHCSNQMGEADSTQYFTPTVNNGYLIGSEIRDPAFTPDTYSRCPSGRKCRRSDANLVLANGNLQVFHTYSTELNVNTKQISLAPTLYKGTIFKTTGRGHNSGSIDLGRSSPPYGHLRITDVDNFIVQGTETNKIGERTGWTYGTMVNPCKSIDISGDRTLLCQNVVQAGADHGDSGAPVFENTYTPPDSVIFDGTLSGGYQKNDKQYYWYSTVTRIKNELGDDNIQNLSFTYQCTLGCN